MQVPVGLAGLFLGLQEEFSDASGAMQDGLISKTQDNKTHRHCYGNIWQDEPVFMPPVVLKGTDFCGQS